MGSESGGSLCLSVPWVGWLLQGQGSGPAKLLHPWGFLSQKLQNAESLSCLSSWENSGSLQDPWGWPSLTDS